MSLDIYFYQLCWSCSNFCIMKAIFLALALSIINKLTVGTKFTYRLYEVYIYILD